MYRKKRGKANSQDEPLSVLLSSLKLPTQLHHVIGTAHHPWDKNMSEWSLIMSCHCKAARFWFGGLRNTEVHEIAFFCKNKKIWDFAGTGLHLTWDHAQHSQLPQELLFKTWGGPGRGPERICRILLVAARVSHTCYTLRTLLLRRTVYRCSGVVRSLRCNSSLWSEVAGMSRQWGYKRDHMGINYRQQRCPGDPFVQQHNTTCSKHIFAAHINFFSDVRGQMSLPGEINLLKPRNKR
jgi:hypothetical protein